MIQRTSLFLMANLGSEVARLYAAQGVQVDESRKRALHIVDQLIAHPHLRGRTSEIEILRDVIQNISIAEPRYEVERKDLEAYFMPFATRTLQEVS